MSNGEVVSQIGTKVQTKTPAEIRQGLGVGERLDIIDCPHCGGSIGVVSTENTTPQVPDKQ